MKRPKWLVNAETEDVANDRLIAEAKAMADELDTGKADPFMAASIMRALVRRLVPAGSPRTE